MSNVHLFFRAPFAPENNEICMNDIYVISEMLIEEIKYN